MARVFALTVAMMTWLAGTVTAQPVVELYTSQGCASCPPADRIFHEFAERDDVIALSFHVDYWDYIGWKDAFAHPDHAERQRSFARVAGRRSIYTPQVIVNGVTDIVGTRPAKLAAAVMTHAKDAVLVDVGLTRAGERATISLTQARGEGPFTVRMLRYTPLREAKITRGENAGKTLTYANVVEALTTLMEWDGTQPVAIDVEAPGDNPVVVLVQRGAHGPIVGAARLR